MTLALELSYRYQLIDNYAPELRVYNSPQTLAAQRKTILILGDSFTAGSPTYPPMLRQKIRDYRIINGGIPGSGIIQACIVAPDRFKELKPDIFIYQVYVGNDLFDIRYPVDLRTISPIRNLYWFIGNRLRFISFLNYRLGQIWANFRSQDKVVEVPDIPFSKAAYDTRTKEFHVKAEPSCLNDSIEVKNERAQDFRVELRKLSELLALAQRNRCCMIILIVPCCCQVNARYMENFECLGSTFEDKAAILSEDDYPFIRAIKERFRDISVLNPLAKLREADSKQRVYYQNDGHLNKFGQEVLANFVYEQLRVNNVFRDYL